MHKVAQYRARHLQGLQFWATQNKFSPPCSQCFHCDNTVVADDTTRWLQWEMLALCQHDATGPGPWLWVPRHHARLQTRWGRRRPVAAPHGPQPQGGTEYLRPTAGMKGWEEHHCHHDQSMALTGRHPQAMPRAGLLCWERPWTAEITSEQKVLLVPPSSTVYTHKSHGCWKNGVAQLYPAEDGICSVRRHSWDLQAMQYALTQNYLVFYLRQSVATRPKTLTIFIVVICIHETSKSFKIIEI